MTKSISTLRQPSFYVFNIIVLYTQNDTSDFLSHHGVDPVCWGVFGVFDGEFNDALPLQQTRTGAHGETSHLLHAGDEEIHPAHTHNHKTQLIYSLLNQSADLLCKWMFALDDPYPD